MIEVLSVLRPDRTEADIDSIGAMSMAVNLADSLTAQDTHTDFMTDATRIEGHLCIPYPKEDRTLDNLIAYSLNTYRLRNYDIYHFHVFNYSCIPLILKHQSPTDNIVITLHLSPMVGRSSFLVRDELYELSRLPNIRFVCVGRDGIADPLLESFKGRDLSDVRFYIIYNGIKDDELAYIPLERRSPEGILVGRMERSKNILEALTFCVKYNHPIVYIGRKSESTRIRSSSREYEDQILKIIQDNPELILHIEKLPNSSLREVMARSLFNLSFSTLEGCALTPLEASFGGTPTLYLDTPGVRDTLPELGKIDPSSIYRKTWSNRYPIIEETLQEMLAGSTDSVRMFIRDRAKSLFSLSRCSFQYQRLYECILNKGEYVNDNYS